MDILRDNLISPYLLAIAMRDKMNRDNRSIRDLSAFLNISKSTIANLVNMEGVNMKANQLIKLIYFLDIDLKDLIAENTQEELKSKITDRYKSFIF